jgi:hypothetical protein
MAGREVFKHAVRSMAEATDRALDGANHGRRRGPADSASGEHPHHRGDREACGIPMEKVFVNVDRFGNTSAASIPIALSDAMEQGRVKEGSTVLFAAFGAGFTWGSMSCVRRFSDDPPLSRAGLAEAGDGEGPRTRPSRRPVKPFQRSTTPVGTAQHAGFEGPADELMQTHNAQPALLAHSAAVWAVARRSLAAASRAAAGHSLGEFSAYHVGRERSSWPRGAYRAPRGQLMYETGRRRSGRHGGDPRSAPRAHRGDLCAQASASGPGGAGELQQRRAGRDLRRSGGRRARDGAGQGGRGQALPAAAGEWRLPFAAHEAGGGRAWRPR